MARRTCFCCPHKIPPRLQFFPVAFFLCSCSIHVFPQLRPIKFACSSSHRLRSAMIAGMATLSLFLLRCPVATTGIRRCPLVSKPRPQQQRRRLLLLRQNRLSPVAHNGDAAAPSESDFFFFSLARACSCACANPKKDLARRRPWADGGGRWWPLYMGRKPGPAHSIRNFSPFWREIPTNS